VTRDRARTTQLFASTWRDRASCRTAAICNGARAITVFVHVNTAKQAGDAEHIKVFASVEAAERWFEENDPEGVAFEYEVIDAA
jgi:hypothetical protein